MAYDPTEWSDKVVERPLTYRIQDNGDGTVTFIPEPGTVYNPGVPFTAALANKFEQGIASASQIADDAKASADASVKKAGDTMTGPLTMGGEIIFIKGTSPLTKGIKFGDGTGWHLPFRTENGDKILDIYDWGDMRIGPGETRVYHQGNKPIIKEGTWAAENTASTVRVNQSQSWTLVNDIMLPRYLAGAYEGTKRRVQYNGTWRFGIITEQPGVNHYVQARIQIGNGPETVIGNGQVYGEVTDYTYFETDNTSFDTEEVVHVRTYSRTDGTGTADGHTCTIRNNSPFDQYFVVLN